MEILKTFFRKRDDGVWEITGLQGIDLHGGDTDEEDFYAIQDGIVAIQGQLPSTIQHCLGESIVPIVVNVHGDRTLRCVGTVFIISCTGLLISAAHVITDPIDRQYGEVSEVDDLTWHARRLSIGALVPSNPILEQPAYRFYPFEWCMFLAERRPNPLPFSGTELKLMSDIALCKMPPTSSGSNHQPLTIIQPGIVGKGIDVNTEATAIGYSGMTDIELRANEKGEIFGDIDFRLYASSGIVLERFPDNFEKREVSTPGPCFSFSAKIPGGMSGAPIFDHEGIYVHGVVSKGLEEEAGISSLGSDPC